MIPITWWFSLGLCLVAGVTGAVTMHKIDLAKIERIELDDAKAAQKAMTHAVTIAQAEDKASQDIAVSYARSQREVETVTRSIIEKVPVYVTQKQNDACVLPNSFIKLLDGAGTATEPQSLPGASGEPDASPSGIPLSQATTLLVQNLGDAAENKRQLKSLESWVETQEAIPR